MQTRQALAVSRHRRSFDTAIGAVGSNGEVIVLDSGGYGRFDVTKSVTVTAPPGVYAGISVFDGTNGVDINTAGVEVILRGLGINGQGGVWINLRTAIRSCSKTVRQRNGARGYCCLIRRYRQRPPSERQVVATTITRSGKDSS